MGTRALRLQFAKGRVYREEVPSGGLSEADPPVPIPNTEVKRLSADDTAPAREWENRSLPGGSGICESVTVAET